MTQSQGTNPGPTTPPRRTWPLSIATVVRRWIDSALLSNSIVVYRVEDPYTESVSGEEHPATTQRQQRYASGELRL